MQTALAPEVPKSKPKLKGPCLLATLYAVADVLVTDAFADTRS